MIMYHGTSSSSSKKIQQEGFQFSLATLSIDNQGFNDFINAVFISPHKEIAHIYETNSKSISDKKGNPVIIELELISNNIFDLTKKENQQILINYIMRGNSINDFLKENSYDGIRQIHKNDFGKIRLQYAITNINVLKITNIPKKSTSYMSLYNEAMLPDWE